MQPKVSILWINHNSTSFIELVLESLQAVRDLDYLNYEVIIVDNGSVDDSFTVIKNFTERNNIGSKLFRLDKNFGFTGGNNFAYANRDSDSRYVVLLNNDAVPQKNSLGELVEHMENDQTLGAAQGVILNLDERSIDTAGDYLSEFFIPYPLFTGKYPKSLRKPVRTTSADGSYSIYRIEAIRRTMGQIDSMFDSFIFACYDDFMLGLKLWNHGFKVEAFPLIAAKHRRGSSVSKVIPLLSYLGSRNRTVLNEISNSRYKNLIRLLSLKQPYGWFFSKTLGVNVEADLKGVPALLSKAFIDGMRIGRMKKKIGDILDIYKAPILRVALSTALAGTMISLQLMGTRDRKELDRIACLCADEK